MPEVFHGSALTAFSAMPMTSTEVATPAMRSPAHAVALFPYHAQLACDLSFSTGQLPSKLFASPFRLLLGCFPLPRCPCAFIEFQPKPQCHQ